jgi:segregation and condensation protein A
VAVVTVPAATEGFVVETPLFTGPFRLLADLILERRMDVCDVPVARITDQFVRRGREEAAAWPLDEVTWFLAICATMLELKVGRLLPTHAVETEADLLGAVSPDLLYARSVELAAFRGIADLLDAMFADAALLVARNAAAPPEFAHLSPDVLEGVRVDDLAALAAVALAPPPVVDLSHVAPIRVSLADAMALVQARVSVTGVASFRDLLADEPERIHIVVRFLALLELHRQGKVELSQAQLFGDIQVRWQGGSNGAPELEVSEGPA